MRPILWTWRRPRIERREVVVVVVVVEAGGWMMEVTQFNCEVSLTRLQRGRLLTG